MQQAKSPKPQIIYYNQVCKNHGQHPRCEGRFKRYDKQSADLCPSCIHLARKKK